MHGRGADIAGFASLDDVMERLQRFLDRRRIVPAIGPGRMRLKTLVASTMSSRRAKSLMARPTISSEEPLE